MNNRISLFFTLALACAVSCTRANLPDSDFVLHGLSAPAKSYKVYQKSSTFNDPNSNIEVFFNENGRKDSLAYYLPDGSFLSSESYDYDDSGRLVRLTSRDKNGRVNGTYEYTYKHSCPVIATCTLFGMNNDEVLRWEHKNNGAEIIQTDFYSEGELQNTFKSTFSDSVREEKVYDPSGTEVLSNHYEYYDLKNKLVSRIQNEDTLVSIQYNEEGLPCESRGAIVSAQNSLYWDNTKDDSSVFTYEYEFDLHHNWTKRLRHTNSSPTPDEILIRKIRY